MASGYPLRVNGNLILSSEALYQACRFPHKPDIQRLIIEQKSPMTAKMVSKPHLGATRPDWDRVRVRVMRWALRVKLAMHWEKFGRLLRETGDKPIVEDSRRDDFWGAIKQHNGMFVGMNVLGRLLMELREELKGAGSEMLRFVDPLQLTEFLLFSEPIGRVGLSPLLVEPDVSVYADNAGKPSTPATAQSARPVPEVKEAKINEHPMAYPKRLIEVDLPIKRISAHARREKSIRHGHISTLHIWWARRPLAACRAVLCASLWPDPADPLCPEKFREIAKAKMMEWARDHLNLASEESWPRIVAVQKDPTLLDDLKELRRMLFDFIADFANWDNSSNRHYLRISRGLTNTAHEGMGGIPDSSPLVLDPFSGGGAIPLEALRIGCESFASDLNPVAVLLNKTVVEYVPRFGKKLVNEFSRCSELVNQRLTEELAEFYGDNEKYKEIKAFIWARTILSEAPGEDEIPIEIPLLRSMILLNKKGRYKALRWQRDQQGKIVTEILRVRYDNGQEITVKRPLLEIFQPSSTRDVEKGTSSGGAATCPITGFTTSVESVRQQLETRQGGAGDARLICVVVKRAGSTGKLYLTPEKHDYEPALRAKRRLKELVESDIADISLVPDGKLNHLRGFFNVILYGMRTWGDLFSPRQALGLVTLSRLIREVDVETEEAGLRGAVLTCLALALDRCADKCASLVIWDNTRDMATHVFGRQALPMVWDFAEVSLLSENGWAGASEWVRKVLENNERADLSIGTAIQASATKHPLPDDTVDAVVTDPPYYAAIPYADLSDFFYSWLTRTVGDIHPELLRSELAPKNEECVSLSHRASMYRHKDSSWFESMIATACAESRRVAKPAGIGIFVFANKETAGWEAMLNGLVTAGWTVTGSWPIDTEMATRLRARNSAALASSVHLVCRPRENPDGSLRKGEIGDWRDVLQELPQRIHAWMPRLADEGVVGADAIFACLGPALEIFSRYSSVEKADGTPVPLRDYLEQVWAAVSKEALNMVFQGADATGFEEDARLTAMWLWTLAAGAGDNGDDDAKVERSTGYAMEYDAARKIAQGLGAHMDDLPHLVEVKGDQARLLAVAERTKHLFGKDEAQAPPGRGRKKVQQGDLFEELKEIEAESGWGVTGAPKAGETVLDRIHQSMILFAANRGEALKRFLVEEGAGRDPHFWRLAQALSALYPAHTDEKRWVDGVLARKKGLGF